MIFKNILLVLSIMFVLLTLAGAGYVLSTGGLANAGFAVVPMVFAIAFVTAYTRAKKAQ